jgi:hypothetical protein
MLSRCSGCASESLDEGATVCPACGRPVMSDARMASVLASGWVKPAITERPITQARLVSFALTSANARLSSRRESPTLSYVLGERFVIGDAVCAVNAVGTALLDAAERVGDAGDPRVVVLVEYTLGTRDDTVRAPAIEVTVVDSHGVTLQPRPARHAIRSGSPQDGSVRRMFVLSMSGVRHGFELVLSQSPAVDGCAARLRFELG